MKIDTALDDVHDEPVIEAANGDVDEMEVDPDEANNMEKNADLEVEEGETEEEISWHDEEAQTLVREMISPLIPKGRVKATKTRNRNRILRPMRSRINRKMKMIMRLRLTKRKTKKNLCPMGISKTRK